VGRARSPDVPKVSLMPAERPKLRRRHLLIELMYQ